MTNRNVYSKYNKNKSNHKLKHNQKLLIKKVTSLFLPIVVILLSFAYLVSKIQLNKVQTNEQVWKTNLNFNFVFESLQNLPFKTAKAMM